MNLIPILVGGFGGKWWRRKNVNLTLNNILRSPRLSVRVFESYGHRMENEKREREGKWENTYETIKNNIKNRDE